MNVQERLYVRRRITTKEYVFIVSKCFVFTKFLLCYLCYLYSAPRSRSPLLLDFRFKADYNDDKCDSQMMNLAFSVNKCASQNEKRFWSFLTEFFSLRMSWEWSWTTTKNDLTILGPTASHTKKLQPIKDSFVWHWILFACLNGICFKVKHKYEKEIVFFFRKIFFVFSNKKKWKKFIW